MATSKAYTDIEQSKKLAEFLPIESADAWWAEWYEGKVISDGQYIVNEEPFYHISFIKPSEINYSQDTVKDIPCWSLAALLDYLSPNFLIDIKNTIDKWKLDCRFQVIREEELIDACVEMIIKLNEQKLL